MSEDATKPTLRVKRELIIDEDGSRRHVVRRLREDELEDESYADPQATSLQNAVFEDDPYVLRSFKEALVFDRLDYKPIEVEVGVLEVLSLKCWFPSIDDEKAFVAPQWSWQVACSWIAAQTREGAIANTAAHRHWEGRTIRDGCRPGQVMSFSEASNALRRALERGEICAKKDDGVGADLIPTPEWMQLDWETVEGETREYVRLLRNGVLVYRNPVLIASQIKAYRWSKEGLILREDGATPENPELTPDVNPLNQLDFAGPITSASQEQLADALKETARTDTFNVSDSNYNAKNASVGRSPSISPDVEDALRFLYPNGEPKSIRRQEILSKVKSHINLDLSLATLDRARNNVWRK